MLTSDGLGREAFMRLWREQMWDVGGLDERGRLVLELGRLHVREHRRADPMVIAVCEHRERPIVLMPVDEAPTAEHPKLRQRVREALYENGADQVFVIMTLAAGTQGAIPQFLLIAWGESRTDQTCWMQPFRWVGDDLEQAPAMNAPAPSTSAPSKMLAGLLGWVH